MNDGSDADFIGGNIGRRQDAGMRNLIRKEFQLRLETVAPFESGFEFGIFPQVAERSGRFDLSGVLYGFGCGDFLNALLGFLIARLRCPDDIFFGNVGALFFAKTRQAADGRLQPMNAGF